MPAPSTKPEKTPTTTETRLGTARLRRGPPTIAELEDRVLDTDRLWTIEHVAAFLECGVREAEEIVNDLSVPVPALWMWTHGRVPEAYRRSTTLR